MLFNPKTNGFEMRSKYPFENWKGDSSLILIDDSSEIAKKIYENYPNIRVEIEDGEIKEVSVTEKVTKTDVTAEINAAKKELSESDYRVIKCMEYTLAGKELPYDIESLHEHRQGLRDKINNLEGVV